MLVYLNVEGFKDIYERDRSIKTTSVYLNVEGFKVEGVKAVSLAN